MSEDIHSNSKGSKNPNSRNPAAGGGVRSSSSQHPPLVGKHQASQISPFQKGIFSACKAMDLPVPKNEISNFAEAYASANSGLKFKFHSDDIEKAKEIFQNKYRPPPQIQHSKNPNNLFRILMKEGKSMGIEHTLLIDYLNWYIKNRVSQDIAENPCSDVITQGIAEMIREISPGGVMFKNICEHGLSPTTIGEPMFEKIMKMKWSPKNGHIWALQKCPNIRDLQKALFFEKPKIPKPNGQVSNTGYVEQYKNVACFVAGVFFYPDGTTGFFTQEPNRGSVDPVYDPAIKDLPAIIWSTSIGTLNSVFQKDHDRINDAMRECCAIGGICYVGSEPDGNDITPTRHFQITTENHLRNEQEEALFKRGYPNLKEQLPHDDAFLRSNPEYKRLADEAMTKKFKGIPVPLYSEIEHEDAVTAEGSGQCAENAEPLSWGAAAEL